MPGGSEYILHDIDENNFIVGKARFSGHVKVSESMGVDGFGGNSFLDDTVDSDRNEEEGDVQDSDDADSDNSEVLDSLLLTEYPSPNISSSIIWCHYSWKFSWLSEEWIGFRLRPVD
jgi:hypothetical protein